MIELSLSPGDLVAQQTTTLTVTVRNAGRGTCTGVTIRLALPPGLLLVSGSLRTRYGRLGAGGRERHSIVVEAPGPGRLRVGVANFSYTDPTGQPRRVADLHWWLSARAAVPRPALVPPAQIPAADHGALPRRGKVFISYRRGDGQHLADRLHSELCREFGAEHVYLDRADRRPGMDFRVQLDRGLAASTAMLVLIGPEWNSSTSTGGRRLDAEHDYVRHEIGTALRADMWIIPVLFGRAVRPRAEELPDDIRELAFRETSEIHDTRVDVDTREIIDALRPHVRART